MAMNLHSLEAASSPDDVRAVASRMKLNEKEKREIDSRLREDSSPGGVARAISYMISLVTQGGKSVAPADQPTTFTYDSGEALL